jgi:membrane peptidoglycan carboxypeptidase
MNRRAFLTALAPAAFLGACKRPLIEDALPSGNPIDVFLTIDKELQEIADRVIATPLRQRIHLRGLPSDTDIAFVCMRNATGDVIGYIGTLQENSEFDNCRSGSRDIGSTAKPIIYGIALQSGAISAAETFIDERLTFPRFDGGGTYSPRNYGDHYTNRSVAIEDALAISSNSVALQVYHRIRQDTLRSYVDALSLPADYNVNLMPLGRWAVPPLLLAAAFTIFPNAGHAATPRLVTAMTGIDGRRSDEPVRTTPQIFAESVCSIISQAMRSCLTHGTGTAASDLANVARGKTGSSQDALSVLQSREMTTVLWIGRRDTAQDLKITGGHVAMPLLARFFREIRKVRPSLVPVWG